MMRGNSKVEPEVKEREVMDFCLDNGIFYIKIHGENKKGLQEAFEFGPVNYLLKKENLIESMIVRQN